MPGPVVLLNVIELFILLTLSRGALVHFVTVSPSVPWLLAVGMIGKARKRERVCVTTESDMGAWLTLRYVALLFTY